ncbi:hypothetical protein JXD38_01255, partial [candidate division WOR-3 bacterium]|nr:hypothetical protein [candidate division WOR-3 bacterium]
RLARVSTGPVGALCFVPPQGKLYVASLDADSVIVVDCATNQVTSAIHTAGIVPVMQYNAQNDRLYCGGDQISIIDCVADSAVGTIPVAALSFGYDSASNKLYVGGSGPLAVIDCTTDSVVSTLPEVGSAIALCLNPTAAKVYAATIDTLFAIQTDGDSVVARLPFDSLGPLLACDAQRNRIYCAGSDRDWGILSSIDCTADTVLETTITYYPLTFLACNSARDMLYVFLRRAYDEVFMYDATNGQMLTSVRVDGIPPGGGWCPALDRLYCFPLVNYQNLGYSCCLFSAIDGTGDSIAGIVPLTVKAEHIVLDTVHNRLYFTYGSSACGCVGVVDCAQNTVTSYEYGGASPYAVCYNPNNNRLYWRSGGSAITVYDCATNTSIKKITASGDVRMMRLNLGLNKLYVLSWNHRSIVDVVDCDGDSVIQVIGTPYDLFQELLLVPEDNTLWCLGVRAVAVVDCLGDSMIYSAADTLGTIDDACACPEDRRLYTAGVTAKLWSINMDKPGERDTLHYWIPGGGGMRFVSIPSAHKAYWAVNNGGVSTHLFSIDTRTNTLVDSCWVNRTIAGMCLDHTGNFVYCAVPYDTLVIVIDPQVDSVVATVGLPPIMVAEKNPLVASRASNRIYLEQIDGYIYGNEIPVIRDSMLIGVEEPAPASPSRSACPTVVRRATPIRVLAASELWDATGRRVAALSVGLNDISHLASGVYFLRGPGTEDRGSSTAVRKVVIAE